MQVESWSVSVCVSSGLFYVAPRVFFVGPFAFKPRTNLAMNFVRLLSAKVRDLTAARQRDNEEGIYRNRTHRVSHDGDEGKLMEPTRCEFFSHGEWRQLIERFACSL